MLNNLLQAQGEFSENYREISLTALTAIIAPGLAAVFTANCTDSKLMLDGISPLYNYALSARFGSRGFWFPFLTQLPDCFYQVQICF